MDWVTVVIETPRHSTGKYFYEISDKLFNGLNAHLVQFFPQ